MFEIGAKTLIHLEFIIIYLDQNYTGAVCKDGKKTFPNTQPITGTYPAGIREFEQTNCVLEFFMVINFRHTISKFQFYDNASTQHRQLLYTCKKWFIQTMDLQISYI